MDPRCRRLKAPTAGKHEANRLLHMAVYFSPYVGNQSGHVELPILLDPQ